MPTVPCGRGAQEARPCIPEPANYPGELQRELVLEDGSRLLIRPILPDDEPRLRAFYERLSESTRYQRFFAVSKHLPADVFRFWANVDYGRRFGLVVERPSPQGAELIAEARYEPVAEPGAAEVAVVVDDRWQNRGIGTALLDHLFRIAEARGVRRLCASVLASNAPMLDFFSRFADVQERKVQSGEIHLEFTRRESQAG